MKKAAFILGSLEQTAVKKGTSLTRRTKDLLAELARHAGLEAIEIIFVTQDEFLAGCNKATIGMDQIRAERPRVIQEIQQSGADTVICFGPVATACLWDAGNITENEVMRRQHYLFGEDGPATYVTSSMENVWRAPGLRQWVFLDMEAAKQGYNETQWGEYALTLPGTPEWGIDPMLPFFCYNGKPLDPELYTSGAVIYPVSVIACDLETYPGLKYYHPNARIRMVQISARPGYGQVIQLEDSKMPPCLIALLEDPKIKKVGSNIGFDAKWLRRFGVNMRNFEDTSIREHIIDCTNPRKNLKALTLKYHPSLGDYEKDLHTLIVQRGKEHGYKTKTEAYKNGWQFIEDHEMYQYAGGDADASIATWHGQKEALFMLERPRRFSQDLNEALTAIEFNGVRVSRPRLAELDSAYRAHLRHLTADIRPILGPINLNSPIQLARGLKDTVPGIDLRIKQIARVLGADEEDDELSTDQKVLEREAHKHPVIRTVMDYRKYYRRHGIYIEKLRDSHLVEHDGHSFVHPTYRLDVATTFRSASRDPNLQNIPRQDDQNPHLSIKRLFVPRHEGGCLVSADQSQIELRVAAWLSQDVAMTDAIASGEDIHTSMARKFLGKPDVTDDERTYCKTLGFLILYGGGAYLLGQHLGISKSKAQGMIDDYFSTFHGLYEYIQRVHWDVKRDLMVETCFGFQRHFLEPENWQSREGYEILRQGFNTRVQGPAFQLFSCSLMWMQKALTKDAMDSKLILQVHDEAVLDAHPAEKDEVREIARIGMVTMGKVMARAQYGVDFTLPLDTDVKTGPSWAEVGK